jgi:hypothetical protein
MVKSMLVLYLWVKYTHYEPTKESVSSKGRRADLHDLNLEKECLLSKEKPRTNTKQQDTRADLLDWQ